MLYTACILLYTNAVHNNVFLVKNTFFHQKTFFSSEKHCLFSLYLARTNKKIAEGHKASFCLEDTSCLPGVDRKYNCTAGTQGISMNCFDNYAYNIDCQWIDVTDIQYERNYILQVNINPKLYVPETDFDNNVIRCDIRDQGSQVLVRKCQYGRCLSNSYPVLAFTVSGRACAYSAHAKTSFSCRLGYAPHS